MANADRAGVWTDVPGTHWLDNSWSVAEMTWGVAFRRREQPGLPIRLDLSRSQQVPLTALTVLLTRVCSEVAINPFLTPTGETEESESIAPLATKLFPKFATSPGESFYRSALLGARPESHSTIDYRAATEPCGGSAGAGMSTLFRQR